MTAAIIPLNLPPERARAARDAQQRNLAALFPSPAPVAPLAGTVFDLVRGRHLSVLGARYGAGDRITFYSLFDPFTGATVIRTPDQLRGLDRTQSPCAASRTCCPCPPPCISCRASRCCRP